MNSTPYIVWFNESHSVAATIVGEKGIELGKLKQAGLPLPAGFVVTSHAFRDLLSEELEAQIGKVFALINPHQPNSLRQAAKNIQRLIQRTSVPEELVQAIHNAYHQIGENPFVAIRSSQTVSQLPHRHQTVLNLQGDANVIQAIRQIWAELFDEHLLLWLFQHRVAPSEIDTAIIVQRMVQSQKAGVMFTNNPITHNKRSVVIEAVWGLGEYYAQHRHQADRYEVEKNSWQVISVEQKTQPLEFVRKLGATKTYPTPASRKDQRKLNEEELTKLAKLGVKTQQLMFFPQTVEWAFEGDDLFILESQALTEENVIQETKVNQLKPILYGTGATGGVVAGKVQLCTKESDFAKLTPQSIAVVAKLFVKQPALKKVAGLIVDAPVYPRELQQFGFPIIANTKAGTSILKTGQTVTLYGQQGVVYEGALKTEELKTKVVPPIPTQTQVLVSSGEPDKAQQLSKQPVAGVGLLRAEYMMAGVGVHPKYLIKKGKEDLFKHYFAAGIERFCAAFGDRPVVYRFLDFTSQDFSELHGSDDFEKAEENPLLGYRGAYRQLSDPRVWDLELEVLQSLRQKYRNLHMMFPFVRSVEEYVLLNQHLKKFDLTTDQKIQHWLMIDAPSVAMQLEHFAKVGISGFAIGARDLRVLMTGADLSLSGEFAAMYAHDPAYLQLIRQIIQTSKQLKKPVMFCEHTIDQQILNLLIEEQIDQISVNPNQIDFVIHKLGLKGKQ